MRERFLVIALAWIVLMAGCGERTSPEAPPVRVPEGGTTLGYCPAPALIASNRGDESSLLRAP